MSAGGMYDGKLQFLVQCFQNQVSCNTEYISYSLERQLASLCRRHRIDPSTAGRRFSKRLGQYFQTKYTHSCGTPISTSPSTLANLEPWLFINYEKGSQGTLLLA